MAVLPIIFDATVKGYRKMTPGVDVIDPNLTLPEKVDTLVITTNGQTVFAISEVPFSPNTSKAEVNGVNVDIGIDYLINGTVLTWISPKYQLSTTDIFKVYYF